MRRLGVAVAAIVMCLASGGVQVAAQETQIPGAYVSVDQECENIFATPIVCAWSANDPRLTGTLTHEWTARAGLAGWAPATLEGPHGNWTGHLYAVWTDPAQLFVVLSGDGAYAGQQMVASTIDSGLEMGNSEWIGAMYEGELPPFGPPESPVE